jgi:hypothetical protein
MIDWAEVELDDLIEGENLLDDLMDDLMVEERSLPEWMTAYGDCPIELIAYAKCDGDEDYMRTLDQLEEEVEYFFPSVW